MNAVLAFGAALLAFRPAGLLARRWRGTRRPELAAWAWALAAYAVAAAAIAWGEAAQWEGRAFRVYYASGPFLTSSVSVRRSAFSMPVLPSASRSRCRCTVSLRHTDFRPHRIT